MELALHWEDWFRLEQNFKYLDKIYYKQWTFFSMNLPKTSCSSLGGEISENIKIWHVILFNNYLLTFQYMNFVILDNYFRKNESDYSGNPKIPSQPISYSTAYEIFK